MFKLRLHIVLSSIFFTFNVNANNLDCTYGYDVVEGTFVCAEASTEALSRPQLSASPTPLIAEVVSQRGHKFQFVDEGSSIGVAEIAPTNSKSYLEDLVNNQHASALEVYMAVTPVGSTPPQRLVKDHEIFAQENKRPSLEPAQLNIFNSTSENLLTPFSVEKSYDPGFCNYNTSWNPGDSKFTWAWYDGLGKYKDFTAQQTYNYSDLNGNTGKLWYAGSSSERWLSACNENFIFGFPAFEFRAEFRNFLGNWSTAYTTQLEPDFSVKYYSYSSPRKWRIRLREITYNVFLSRIYAVAVAGNKPLPFKLITGE